MTDVSTAIVPDTHKNYVDFLESKTHSKLSKGVDTIIVPDKMRNII